MIGIIVVVCIILYWQRKKVAEAAVRVSVAVRRSSMAIRNSVRKKMGLPPIEPES